KKLLEEYEELERAFPSKNMEYASRNAFFEVGEIPSETIAALHRATLDKYEDILDEGLKEIQDHLQHSKSGQMSEETVRGILRSVYRKKFEERDMPRDFFS